MYLSRYINTMNGEKAKDTSYGWFGTDISYPDKYIILNVRCNILGVIEIYFLPYCFLRTTIKLPSL